MPVFVKKRSGKKPYVVVDPAGKVYGRHRTRPTANRQVSAINLSMLRKAGRKGLPAAPKRKRK